MGFYGRLVYPSALALKNACLFAPPTCAVRSLALAGLPSQLTRTTIYMCKRQMSEIFLCRKRELCCGLIASTHKCLIRHRGRLAYSRIASLALLVMMPIVSRDLVHWLSALSFHSIQHISSPVVKHAEDRVPVAAGHSGVMSLTCSVQGSAISVYDCSSTSLSLLELPALADVADIKYTRFSNVMMCKSFPQHFRWF